MGRIALVFFTTQPRRTGLGGIADHLARLQYALIRVMSRSRIAHVAIAYDNLVYTVSPTREAVWPVGLFVERYPCIAGYVAIPMGDGSPCGSIPGGMLCRGFKRALRVLSGGRLFSDTCCVGRVIQHLVAGGVDVPRSIVYPDQLLRWMLNHGLRYQPLDLALEEAPRPGP